MEPKLTGKFIRYSIPEMKNGRDVGTMTKEVYVT